METTIDEIQRILMVGKREMSKIHMIGVFLSSFLITPLKVLNVYKYLMFIKKIKLLEN